MTGWKAIGSSPTGSRLERILASPLWSDGRFVDVMPRNEPETRPILMDYLRGAKSPNATPSAPPPILTRTADEFRVAPSGGLRITWLGHSTSLVEIDGRRILFDPVWGERSAPFTWAGPKRFHAPPLPFEALPAIDAVVISHDHYDHLDYPTIVRLAATDVSFIVPLGVGAHLEHWGVPPSRITELEWWQEHALGDLRLVATPARHFSGRSLFMNDRDQTLWAGWAIIGPEHRVFFSGDTAMFPGFTEIGERLGPFDATLLESGAYNHRWADVHMGPEQAVEANRMLGGGLMIPVHWGTFDLALHGWTEPVERVLAAAAHLGVNVATPRIGESITPSTEMPMARWWPEVPWTGAEQAPVISSGLRVPTGRAASLLGSAAE